MEEEVLDMHKATIELSPRWQQLDMSLLNMTNEVDYDVDGERCPCLRSKSGICRNELVSAMFFSGEVMSEVLIIYTREIGELVVL